MKTLALTSPHMQGKPVATAQRRLASGNVLKRDFLRGPIDGEFGPATARACIRAKFWLGNPEKELKGTYGDALDRFLTGKAKPDPAMVKRAIARAKQPPKPMRVKALEFMESKVGTKESPAGSNRIGWASTWYGLIGPWCAMAVTRAYVEAGSKAFVRGSKYAYCPFIVNDARFGLNGLVVTTDPQPGDLVLFNWDGDWDADHVGLFQRWKIKGATFVSVEGNTSLGNNSNGGATMVRGLAPGDIRRVSQVQAFVRVGR